MAQKRPRDGPHFEDVAARLPWEFLFPGGLMLHHNDEGKLIGRYS